MLSAVLAMALCLPMFVCMYLSATSRCSSKMAIHRNTQMTNEMAKAKDFIFCALVDHEKY